MKPANFICVAVLDNHIYVMGMDIRNISEDLETSNDFFVLLDNCTTNHELIKSFFNHDIGEVIFTEDPLRDFCLINLFTEYHDNQSLTTNHRLMLEKVFTDWGYVGLLKLDFDAKISQFIAEDLIEELQSQQTIRRIK